MPTTTQGSTNAETEQTSSPSLPASVLELLDTKAIPAFDAYGMAELSQYLFKSADRPLRFEIAEILYRHNHGHPEGVGLFLACAMPLAQRMAERKAYRIFAHPSDWQIEKMYDGAVAAVINLFQHHAELSSMPNAFRRYLLRTISLGSLRDYFKREEYYFVRGVENLAAIPAFEKALSQYRGAGRDHARSIGTGDQLPDAAVLNSHNSSMYREAWTRWSAQNVRILEIRRPREVEEEQGGLSAA